MTTDSSALPLRRRAVQAAMGKTPFDKLLKNANLLDMVTGEIRLVDIGLTGSMIASVHPCSDAFEAVETLDLAGAYLSPGLIDTHVHVESSHLSADRYAQIVVAQGTTTIYWDPHELANVLGVAGVRYAVESSRGLSLRVICAAPSSVPSTPGLETSGADFRGAEMQTMLDWPEVAGVAEMMDMHGVINGSERMLEILEAGLQSGKLIEGHARGLKGKTLQAYLAAGVGSDHELTSAEDALEKLRAGLNLQIRGSHPYLLPDIVAALNALPHLSSQITLCTDDVPPDFLMERGGMIALVNTLIDCGLRAEDVLRMASFNAALRLKRDDLGLIAAGRTADFFTFDSLQHIRPARVFVNGEYVAEAGHMLREESAPPSAMQPPRATVHLNALQATDFQLRIPGIKNGKATLRHIKGARFTQWNETTVEVRDGIAQLPAGFSLIWVQHRHGKSPAKPQMALLEGWGELRGAIATTYSHDSHNLVVLGRNPADMVRAANHLIACGGGMALAQNAELLASVEMPIAGMLSDLPASELAAQFKNLRELSAQIADWEPPYRVFKAIEGTCLACNAGPHLTDLGLTDGGTRQIINPLVAAWEIE
ncbi:amidohydrolase family protein [Rouxiella badensis]|uniref:adenine deaminase n=1 Tax=Rouxiella badensis TaxID=1646377 RepID=UPI001D138BFA|nr:adenine deaminase C-terminal domain-containing protein [Rouxiella badensis]MCC3717201.1 amidohydrolase family protein [Rouxiella badensis]MCC3728297.1 amidohydrolase family protein [Rouxiella badensis]MCC3732201.1 amidohydrolase family protein [Rouxiella badensis]MCC3740041.1 amidohydrolase family protein [Rouxiella badensis]MCC3759082.1 amidohydrolase family protein [Rouxiella badensis]